MSKYYIISDKPELFETGFYNNPWDVFDIIKEKGVDVMEFSLRVIRINSIDNQMMIALCIMTKDWNNNFTVTEIGIFAIDISPFSKENTSSLFKEGYLISKQLDI